MKMSNIAVSLAIAVGLYTIIFIVLTIFMVKNCGLMHVPITIQCWIYSPLEISGIIGGVVFGWKRKITPSIFGFIVPVIGLSLVWVFGYLDYFIGSNYWYGIKQLVISSVLPALLSSMLISLLSNRLKGFE